MSSDKPPRKRRPTPQKPPLRGRIIEPPAPRQPPPRRDPATVSGMRSGIYCPDCRAELLHQPLSILACGGCGLGYWQRGGELIREGEYDAVVTPDNHLPRARATLKKRDE